MKGTTMYKQMTLLVVLATQCVNAGKIKTLTKAQQARQDQQRLQNPQTNEDRCAAMCAEVERKKLEREQADQEMRQKAKICMRDYAARDQQV